MPRVSSGTEGTTGFYVRGGGIDQNLIILDEAPIYSVSHLMGFFSVFNSDAIKDMKLYKGNAPAMFGGRLSSILDIQMNEGNAKKFSASGGLGLLASRLTIESSIVKTKVRSLSPSDGAMPIYFWSFQEMNRRKKLIFITTGWT